MKAFLLTTIILSVSLLTAVGQTNKITNGNFEDTSGTFPNGWTVTQTVTANSTTPLQGLVSANTVSTAGVIWQDFAPNTADGLFNFRLDFMVKLTAANTSQRVRIRGNGNASDIITLRFNTTGIDRYSSAAWAQALAVTISAGTTYYVRVTGVNFDLAGRYYTVGISTDGVSYTTSSSNTGFHSAAVGTGFETLTLEAGSGGGALWDAVSAVDTTPVATNLLANPGFEATPFGTAWNTSGVISDVGLNGSFNSARLPFNTTATLGQTVTPLTDFTFDAFVQIAGNTTPQSFRILLDGNGGPAIEIRGATNNVIQLNRQGDYVNLTAISTGATFPIAANTPIRIRVIGHNFGSVGAAYDLAWSNAGSSNLVHAATGLTSFVTPAAATNGSGLSGIRFDRNDPSAHSYLIDDVGMYDMAATPPSADYEYSPTPPNPPKVVNISGIYPHLAMMNDDLECGIGAVAPWAGRLWAVTYSPHTPTGSSSKLYEIDTNLNITIRPESVGGTPANRFIHKPSSQLIIGPHLIDTNRNVRTLSYSVAPGRHTAVAAHLTDPTNRVYLFTMEDGVYDINVNDLSFITRYPDRQSTGDQFLFGYHGKGAYSGQGLLVVANNGRPNLQSTFTLPAGVLATWNGTTVSNNGGSYFASNDPNNTSEENGVAAAAAQSQYMAGWNQIYKVQHCEVTGPGGISGNPNPATDPVWATGFDLKSVLLRVMEGGVWRTWRLPKASYTHDASHGWYTEWPRIRQLDPGTPGSPYLMHMHGLFYNFPATFSATNFSGLAPICDYYKMPVDYCAFGGRIVIAKDDASKFNNNFVPRSQSGLWFGRLSDLQQWGQPAGHGSVWMNEAVTNSQISDPFLVNGFSQGTLHLRNKGIASVPVDLQVSSGNGGWTTLRTLNVAANGYLYDNLNNLSNQWVRLGANASSTNLTAFFHLSNPYSHTPVASIGTDCFAALADIRDTNGYSDGLIRVMAGTDLKLEFASSAGYHQIGADMVLNNVNDPNAEAACRAAIPITKDFGSDAASAYVDSSGTRFRLPKTDMLYDAPFASGWPRGLREVVTERQLLNCQGTFYEIPRSDAGGFRKMRALTTHGKRIMDFASWRGMLVIAGVLDDAPASDTLVKNTNSTAGLWLGEVDDLWRMGEPRGLGGPWLNTVVAANTPSDPFLMYGYDHKELKLSHTNASPVTFTVQVDFLADNTWSTYNAFVVNPGETFTHVFPSGFHAHWVRVSSSAATSATAQFAYGPTVQRDALLDWARTNNLPTAFGRYAVAMANGDGDSLPDMAEFVLGTNPAAANNWPLVVNSSGVFVTLRNLTSSDGLVVVFESSTNLLTWVPRPDLVIPTADQTSVPSGFTHFQFAFTPSAEAQRFVRLRLYLL